MTTIYSNVNRAAYIDHAALLAQAERVDPGRTIVIDDERGIIEVDAAEMQIVTWRGTHASDEAAP